MGSGDQILDPVTCDRDRDHGGVPIQRLSEEEQEMLRYQRELERQRIRRLRDSPPSDQMWPRRKRSDLMAHLTPNYRERRVMVDPEPVPVKVPVKQQVPAKTGPSQDSMWPRRRKSDLLIYQQTRNV